MKTKDKEGGVLNSPLIKRLRRRGAIHAQNEAFVEELINQSKSAHNVKEQGRGLELASDFYHNRGDLLKSVSLLEEAISLNPLNMQLQMSWRHSVGAMGARLEELGTNDPANPEILALYKKLLKIGNVNLECHLIAAYHRHLLGDSQGAREIFEKLKNCYPNLIGLKELSDDLAHVAHPTPPPCPPKSEAAPFDLTRQIYLQRAITEIEKIEGAETPEGHTQLLAKLEQILKNHDLSEEPYTGIWYQKAILLDCLNRPMDALEIFSKLLKMDPTNMRYQSSMRIIFERIGTKARETARKPGQEKLLEKFHHLLQEVNFSPSCVITRYCQILRSRGEGTTAKEILVNLLTLSPNDCDYLEAALKLATAARDHQRFEELSQKVRALYDLRPWQMEVASLMALVIEQAEAA